MKNIKYFLNQLFYSLSLDTAFKLKLFKSRCCICNSKIMELLYKNETYFNLRLKILFFTQYFIINFEKIT